MLIYLSLVALQINTYFVLLRLIVIKIPIFIFI
ncbi:hypothetical protein NSTC745_04049 [Nostoc sp. DSM 114161]